MRKLVTQYTDDCDVTVMKTAGYGTLKDYKHAFRCTDITLVM